MRSDERAEFLGDIITTAVEGGTGYWAQVSQYQYALDGRIRACVGERVGDEPRAVLHQLAEDESGYVEAGQIVTLDVIARGLSLLASGEVGVRSDLKALIGQASHENDAGMIDADAADVIVQAGLLGEIVYG